ncbi:hypothetical protein Tco_0063923 [Tanacetum coccineum]
MYNLGVIKVEIANIPCDSNKDDDSKQRMSHEADDDMGYDPSDIRGDDEVELTDEEFSNNEDKVAEVFRIDTNIFDFETPIFKMIKYSFGQNEEYVVVKEDEYDDLARTSEDACRAYQEIFRMMDEGWMTSIQRPRERNIDKYWWRIYKSGDLEVLES